MFEENINLAYKLAGIYKAKYLEEYEDIKQVALIGLWEATKNYNGKYKFSTFAWTVMNRNIIKYLTKIKKHFGLAHLESFVSPTKENLTILNSIKIEEVGFDEKLDKYDIDRTFNAIIAKAKLTKKELNTLEELRQGLNIIQISNKYNVSKQCISQRVKNIFRKVEKVITDEDKKMFM